MSRRLWTLSVFLFLPLLFALQGRGEEISVLPETSAHYNNKSFWDNERTVTWSPDLRDPIRNAILEESRKRRRQWPVLTPIDQSCLAELKIRRYTGKHVAFYTDLPATEYLDDFVHTLDDALPELCKHFSLDLPMFEDWHIDAFLMSSKKAFEKTGALDGAPDFQFGYSHYDRIFVIDQKYDYYNCFLLIHELVHSFMHETFGALNPRWYSEGMAESLALHRFEGNTLHLGIIPREKKETPGFKRLETIQKDVRNNAIPAMETIFRYSPDDYRLNVTYSWSWALALFLQNHPKYKGIEAKMPYYMMSPDPMARLRNMISTQWPRFIADWYDFVGWLDYCYDFEATVIDYTPGNVSSEIQNRQGTACSVPANKGWVNSGIRVEAGKTYRLGSTGRIELYDSRQMVPSEAGGVSYQYIKGRPRGILLMSIFPESSDRKSDFVPWSDTTTVNANRIFKPEYSGTLFLRINDTPGNLSKNRGSLTFHIRQEQI
ncbi:MAG: hypothetical protein PHQ75_01160 [Thermoguttaceae bacterium]|nr:hypothetical protein [Thermoguttaceae bacterium]